MTSLDLLLAFGFLVAAFLYTSVGHAGASAYLALMSFFSLSPLIMRPTALVLNIIVASLSSFRFIKAKQFDFKLFLPFMAGSLPFAFFGGKIVLDASLYRPLVGIILLLTALRLLFPKSIPEPSFIKHPNIIISFLCGAMIGFISGLTGTGGGIFLSPLLLFMGWAPATIVSGIAVTFILGTSLAGLAGNYLSLQNLPSALPLYILAVVTGGFLGSRFGVSIKRETLMRLLSLVLIIAGLKLVFT